MDFFDKPLSHQENLNIVKRKKKKKLRKTKKK